MRISRNFVGFFVIFHEKRTYASEKGVFKERFIVVSGTLDIEVDGEHRILEVGEAILLTPGQVHQLKSGGKILCAFSV